MKMRLIVVVIAVALGAASAGVADVKGKYVWPLETQSKIAAGFCDYRARHYHGGIDISTGGVEGLPVRAADSGWVLRVSTSYWAFGKVVYLQLADGTVAVYGHLSEFAPKIAAYVESEQYDSKRYQQNLLPAPGQIPIARGEIIAKTGQTGAGPAHLHFELRTMGNRPLNVLKADFEKTDTITPRIYSITIVPRQPDDLKSDPSTVNGSLLPVNFDLSGPADHRAVAETLTVTGTVGIAAYTDDQIDDRAGKVSPYRLRLYANDRVVCEVRYDSLNYDNTRQIDLERFFNPSPGIEPRAVNLFRWERNTLWYYDSLANNGWLAGGETLRIGKNAMRIEVEDAAGNQCVALFELMLSKEPPATSVRSKSTSDVPTILSGWNGLAVSFDQPDAKEIECFADRQAKKSLRGIAVDGGHWLGWLPVWQGLDSIWFRIHPAKGKGQLRSFPLGWIPVRWQDGGVIKSDDGHAAVTIGPEDLYESSYFALRSRELPPAQIRPLSTLYEFAPSDIPLARDVRLRIAMTDKADQPQKLGIYQYSNASSGWEFSGNDLDSDSGWVSAAVPSTGNFALLIDTTPPVIKNVSPSKGESLTDLRPMIRFGLTDDLSGIGSDADVQLHIDGDWVPVEYDPELNRAKAQPRADLSIGLHQAEILVRDRAGNESTFTRTVKIVK